MILKELRLGMTRLGLGREVKHGDGIDYLITGQADYVELQGNHALILDVKTGRGEYEEASGNRQLRGLAALLFLWKPNLEKIRVGLIQPWNGRPTVAEFDREALVNAVHWLEMVVDEVDSATPDDRAAGKWCQYCAFGKSGDCSVFQAAAMAPVETLTARPLPDDPKTALFARAMELDGPSLAAILDKRKLNDWFWAAIEGAAKRRIDAGETIPGYRLHTTKPKESITAVGVVWNNLSALGCQPAEFTAACGMTKAKLEPLVRKLTNTKGKGLQAAVASALEGAVTLGKPSVRLVAAGEVAELEEGES